MVALKGRTSDNLDDEVRESSRILARISFSTIVGLFAGDISKSHRQEFVDEFYLDETLYGYVTNDGINFFDILGTKKKRPELPKFPPDPQAGVDIACVVLTANCLLWRNKLTECFADPCCLNDAEKRSAIQKQKALWCNAAADCVSIGK